MGVLAAVPVVRLCNVCCLWIIAGGFAAAYLSGRRGRVEVLDGALIGLLFGLTYGFVVNVALLVVGVLLNFLGLGANVSQGLPGLQVSGILGSVVRGVFRVVLGVFFGAAGGVLYAAFSSGGQEKVE